MKEQKQASFTVHVTVTGWHNHVCRKAHASAALLIKASATRQDSVNVINKSTACHSSEMLTCADLARSAAHMAVAEQPLHM